MYKTYSSLDLLRASAIVEERTRAMVLVDECRALLFSLAVKQQRFNDRLTNLEESYASRTLYKLHTKKQG